MASKNGINKETIKKMLSLATMPFSFDKEVYHYLKHNKIITCSIWTFQHLLASYRQLKENDNIEDTSYRQLNDVELNFCEIVEHMKSEPISMLKKIAFEGAISDETGRVALSFLDRYDYDMKNKDAEIKKPDVEVHNDNKQINIIFKKASE